MGVGHYLFSLLLALMLSRQLAQGKPCFPYPAEVSQGGSEVEYFVINENVQLIVSEKLLEPVALFMWHEISLLLSWANPKRPSVKTVEDNIESKHIILKINRNLNLPNEGYVLEIEENRISVQAPEVVGVFWAVQTIFQSMEKSEGEGKISTAKIKDYPRFQWRGLLLDSSRHFQPKEFIMRYIDLLAIHKMNRFHWHISDDQGWRIEIKKYPKLTQVGAYRKRVDGGIYGGFYTQDDIREIVAYAKSRFVEIVPEIDIPGHSVAAIASYPELSCPNVDPMEVETKWGVFDGILCVGKEEVFEFVKNVFEEVISLFPSPWIHIGGDECPRKNWSQCPLCKKRMEENGITDVGVLQSYFIKRVAEFLKEKGKIIIGWDEILEPVPTNLPQGTIIQSWRGMNGAYVAASNGFQSIVSPVGFCYLDHLEVSLRTVFAFDPLPPTLPENQRNLILGGEVNMWTEFAPPELIDQRVFPRLIAFSQVLWSPQIKGNYYEFEQNAREHISWLSFKGVNVKIPESKHVNHPLGLAGEVVTSLKTYLDYLPEKAFDGNVNTFFWSESAPSPHDHVTLLLDVSITASKIRVITGKESVGEHDDILEYGALEISKDANHYEKVATFIKGVAEYNPISPFIVKSVRIRATLPQRNWLAIREIVIIPFNEKIKEEL